MSVLKLAPNFAQKSEVLYKLAIIFGKTYQLDKAINYFQMANNEPNIAPAKDKQIDILIKIGICYDEKKEYEKAMKCYESVLSMNNQSVPGLQHIAWTEFLLEKHKQALDHINSAISFADGR